MHLLIGILGDGSAIVELKCRVQARIHWKIRQKEDEIRKCSSPDLFNNKKEILEMPYHIMEAGVTSVTTGFKCRLQRYLFAILHVVAGSVQRDSEMNVMS